MRATSNEEVAEQRWEALAPLSKASGASILATWLGLTTMALVWWMIDPRGVFVFAGFLACLVLSLPLAFGRQYDLASPWSLVLLAAYLGFALRGLFITVGIDGTRTVEQLYFMGQAPAYFELPSLLIVVALLGFTLGYMAAVSGKKKPRPGRLLSSTELNPRSVPVVVVVLAAVGFAAFLLYAQATGGLSLDRISGKRTVIGGLNLSTEYQSHGHLRFVNSLSSVALWVQVAYYAKSSLPHGLGTRRGAWLGVLFLNACLLPFYASTRSDVVFVLATAVVIELCLQSRRTRLRKLVLPALIGLLIVSALTALRSADQGATNEGPAATLVDAFVLTHTFSDIPTTVHITEAVPEVLPYANGDTIVSWLASPIPRAMWPEKPIISLGPTVGIVIFGNARTGIPPGLVAESYWNFGIGGMLVIPMLAGVGVGWGYRRLAPFARQSPAAALLFAGVVVRVGIDMTSNSIGYALLQAVQGLLVLVPVAWLVGSSREGVWQEGGTARSGGSIR